MSGQERGHPFWTCPKVKHFGRQSVHLLCLIMGNNLTYTVYLLLLPKTTIQDPTCFNVSIRGYFDRMKSTSPPCFGSMIWYPVFIWKRLHTPHLIHTVNLLRFCCFFDYIRKQMDSAVSKQWILINAPLQGVTSCTFYLTQLLIHTQCISPIAVTMYGHFHPLRLFPLHQLWSLEKLNIWACIHNYLLLCYLCCTLYYCFCEVLDDILLFCPQEILFPGVKLPQSDFCFYLWSYMQAFQFSHHHQNLLGWKVCLCFLFLSYSVSVSPSFTLSMIAMNECSLVAIS